MNKKIICPHCNKEITLTLKVDLAEPIKIDESWKEVGEILKEYANNEWCKKFYEYLKKKGFLSQKQLDTVNSITGHSFDYTVITGQTILKTENNEG